MELLSVAFFFTLRPACVFFALVLFSARAHLARSPSEEYHVLHRKASQPLPPTRHSGLEKRFEEPACPFNPLPYKTETWKALDLDTYLKEYPKGNTLTLKDYATSVGALDLVCGIGASCKPSNCDIRENDWYILFAIQQWNAQANLMYKSIGTAIKVVSDSMNEIGNKLFPDADASGIVHAQKNFVIGGGLTMIATTAIVAMMKLIGAATSTIGRFLDLLSSTLSANLMKKQRLPPIQNGYEVFTHMSWYLDSITINAEAAVLHVVNKVIRLPISSNDGFSEVLKGGIYMNVLPTIPDTKTHLTKVIMALSLNFMFKIMNAFITVGADYCNDKGLNGAWPQKGRLSYCRAHGGPMKNIIRAKGDKSENYIQNAEAIQGIWGFTTRRIIRISEACQRKYKVFRHNPYVNGNFPKDPEADCIFNLPVCYVTDHSSDTWKSIYKHRQHVAEACKKHSHLPI